MNIRWRNDRRCICKACNKHTDSSSTSFPARIQQPFSLHWLILSSQYFISSHFFISHPPVKKSAPAYGVQFHLVYPKYGFHCRQKTGRMLVCESCLAPCIYCTHVHMYSSATCKLSVMDVYDPAGYTGKHTLLNVFYIKHKIFLCV